MKKLGWIGTPFQHLYWWFLGPPMVTSVLFMMQVIYHVIRNRKYL